MARITRMGESEFRAMQDFFFPKEKYGPYPVQDGDELRATASAKGVPFATAITEIGAMSRQWTPMEASGFVQ